MANRYYVDEAWGWLGCLWHWREIAVHFWREWH
jgi:hypothetical protein